MAGTFTWAPSYGASSDRTPRIKSAQFGDGYEQRQADGINPIREIWTLTFSNREIAEIDAIEAFLTSRAGVENFDFTPPRQASPKKFICKRWQRTAVAGVIDSISATFEQVYEV